MSNNNNSENKIPKWILIIAGLFAVMGLFTSAGVYGNPTMLFPSGAEGSLDVLLSWIVRNSAAAIILIVGLILKRPEYLIIGFVGRFATEIGDLLLFASASNLKMAGFIVPMLILEAMILIKLWKLSQSNLTKISNKE